jgi:RNA polymerase sigma factor (sigma-70 family)
MSGELASLEDLAARAVQGDPRAVEDLVRATRDDVYNLAMRMLGHPADAEDATQEILVKVVTRLGSFRGESSLRTWVWRVAANHLLSVKRGRREPQHVSFEGMEEMLGAGVAAGMPPPDGPEQKILEEEVKLGCTQMMLACLDREHRLAFILGDIFDLTGEEGGRVLEIEPAAFRKRLSRARQRMRAFMQRTCGLVSEEAACRCTLQIGPSVHAGLLDPGRLVYTAHPVRALSDPRVRKQYAVIEGAHRSTAVFRSHPEYAAPEGLLERLREMIAATPW